MEGISIFLLKQNKNLGTVKYGQGTDDKRVCNFRPTDIKEMEKFGT
jgi:hypothetical protein